jgi:5-methylcytosine-specific restriction endonuclease McrA
MALESERERAERYERYRQIINAALRTCQCEVNRSSFWLVDAGPEEKARYFSRLGNEALAAIRNHATPTQIIAGARFILRLAEITEQDAGPGPRPKIRPAIRARIIKANDCTCFYCRRRGTLKTDPDGNLWHIDHMLPLSRGGTHDESNLTLACLRCNLEKRTATAAEYMTWLEN